MPHLSRTTLAAYAGPGIPIAAIGLPLVIYLPPYYAGALGLDLAVVGFVFFITRVLDVPLDIMIGNWVDGTRSRWGRFRPWLAAGGAIMMLATFAVFFAGKGVGALYLFGWLMLLYAGYSALNVTHMAWGATLSPDYHQRSRVYSFWIAGHLVGLVSVLVLPALVGDHAAATAATPVHLMGGFILVALPLTLIVAFIGTREAAPPRDHPRIRLADMRRLAGSRVLIMLLVADVLFNLAPGITGALFQFVFGTVLGFSAAKVATLLLLYFLSGLAALPLWLKIAARAGKHRAAALACLAGAVLHAGAFFLFDPANPWISYGAIIVAGVPYAAPGFLIRAMMADFGDEERLAGGADRIALLNAVLTTAQKSGYAIPVGVLFPLLALVGFDARLGPANTAEALFWLQTMWIALPVLLLMPAALILARMPLSAARLAEVQSELAASESR